MAIVLDAAAAAAAKSCLTRCDPIHGSPPGSPVPGILQARTQEWVSIPFSSAWKWEVKVKSLSRVRLCETPWTTTSRLLHPWDFSRQEYWSGLPLPSPIGWHSYRQKNCLEVAIHSIKRTRNLPIGKRCHYLLKETSHIKRGLHSQVTFKDRVEDIKMKLQVAFLGGWHLSPFYKGEPKGNFSLTSILHNTVTSFFFFNTITS